MEIRIGFSTTNSWISRAIRWFTDSQTSHCYIRLYDPFLHSHLVVHADLPGVLIEEAGLFDGKNIVIEEFVINDERLKEGFKKNLRFLRHKYDYWNILNWALVLKFSRWFKRKIVDPSKDPSKLICVDFAARILNDSNITHLPIGMLHPKNFRAWMNEHYEEFGWKKETK